MSDETLPRWLSDERLQRLESEYTAESSPEVRAEFADALAGTAAEKYDDGSLKVAEACRDRLSTLRTDHPDDTAVTQALAETQQWAIQAYCRRISHERCVRGHSALREELWDLAVLASQTDEEHVEECFITAANGVVETYTEDVDAQTHVDDCFMGSTMLETLVGLFKKIDAQTDATLDEEIAALESHCEAVKRAEANAEPLLSDTQRAALTVVVMWIIPSVVYFGLVWHLTGHGPRTAIENRLFLTNLSPAYRVADLVSGAIAFVELGLLIVYMRFFQ